MSGAAKMSEFQPDWIIAIGGGSPIDARLRLCGSSTSTQSTTFYDSVQRSLVSELRTKAHFCAISLPVPQTEVTASPSLPITRRVLYPLADFQITPDVAIESRAHLRHACCLLLAPGGRTDPRLSRHTFLPLFMYTDGEFCTQPARLSSGCQSPTQATKRTSAHA